MHSDIGPFTLVPEWVFDAGLSDRAVMLYAILGLYADKDGSSFPARKTLAARLHCSNNSVDRAKAELVESGALVVKERRRKDGGKTSNEYVLVRTPLPTVGESPSPRVRHQELDPLELEPLGTQVPNGAEEDSAQKTELDLLWDALEEHVTKAPLEKSPRAAYAKLAREMFAVGRTPEWVRRTARLYRRRFPSMELTVAALAKWGEELDRGKRTLTEEGRGSVEAAGAWHALQATREPEPDPYPSSVSVLPPEENARRARELHELLMGQMTPEARAKWKAERDRALVGEGEARTTAHLGDDGAGQPSSTNAPDPVTVGVRAGGPSLPSQGPPAAP